MAWPTSRCSPFTQGSAACLNKPRQTSLIYQILQQFILDEKSPFNLWFIQNLFCFVFCRTMVSQTASLTVAAVTNSALHSKTPVYLPFSASLAQNSNVWPRLSPRYPEFIPAHAHIVPFTRPLCLLSTPQRYYLTLSHITRNRSRRRLSYASTAPKSKRHCIVTLTRPNSVYLPTTTFGHATTFLSALQ